MSRKTKRKLQRTSKDQFTLTIPKTLVHVLDWGEKDQLEFGFEKGELTLKRVKKK